MAIASTDIKYYNSQGGLGGAIDESAEITTAGGGFDMENFSYEEYLVSKDNPTFHYKNLCIFVKNTHATETVTGVNIKPIQPGLAGSVLVDVVAAGVNGKNAAEPVVANANTSPGGAVYTVLLDSNSTASLPDLGPGEYHGIWIRRRLKYQATTAEYNSVSTRAAGTVRTSIQTLA